MSLEILLMSAIYISGAAILFSFGLRGWGLAPLGFLAGSFTLASVGLLQFIVGVSTSPIWTVGATCILAVAIYLRRAPRKLPSKKDCISISAGFTVILLIVVLLNQITLVKFHIDSFRYILLAWLLDGNNQDLAAQMFRRRGLSLGIFHSLGRIYGEEYTKSITPLWSLALLASVVWFYEKGTIIYKLHNYRIAVASAIVLLLITNSRYVFHSFYVNGHLIFAACFVCIVASGWLLSTSYERGRPALTALMVVAIAALTMTRPEAFLAIGIGILPFLLSDKASHRSRLLVLAAYGGTSVIWFGYMYLDRGYAAPVSVTAPLCIGVATLIALPVLTWPALPEWRRPILGFVEVSLWLALAIFSLLDPVMLFNSLSATYQNIVLGAGGWGSSLVTISIMIIVTMTLCKERTLIYLRFPISAFVPVFLLLPHLRDLAYRVGDGDSLNRMLIHILPLAVLYLGVAATSDRWRLPQVFSRNPGRA